jgi:hypothetical protein
MQANILLSYWLTSLSKHCSRPLVPCLWPNIRHKVCHFSMLRYSAHHRMFSASADQYILLHILACGSDRVSWLAERLDDSFFIHTQQARWLLQYQHDPGCMQYVSSCPTILCILISLYSDACAHRQHCVKHPRHKHPLCSVVHYRSTLVTYTSILCCWSTFVYCVQLCYISSMYLPLDNCLWVWHVHDSLHLPIIHFTGIIVCRRAIQA